MMPYLMTTCQYWQEKAGKYSGFALTWHCTNKLSSILKGCTKLRLCRDDRILPFHTLEFANLRVSSNRFKL